MNTRNVIHKSLSRQTMKNSTLRKTA